MLTITFWTFIILIFYCYFGYPLLLSLAARISRRAVKKSAILPTVSIVISVWNEEDVIKGKLNNLLALDYPKNKMEILIGSDGSTDKTSEIIQGFSDPQIQLIDRPRRKGKMFTIDELVEKAKSEIIVFTDARQPFARNAIKELVGNFNDPKIGCVSGELIFSRDGGATAWGINVYWDYEKFIRHKESDLHSMIGATGAIYAIRKELFVPVPEHVVLDDVFIPLKIIQKGFRAIFDDSAKAYDEVADSPREEYRRKIRTLAGNYQIFQLFSELFNPFKSPVAIQLFSHKFLRVMVPFLMIAVFFLNTFLMSDQVYQWIWYLQIVFYIMALVGALARYQNHGILKVLSKLCSIPYVFCLLNFSALVGFFKFITSKQQGTWEKARQ